MNSDGHFLTIHLVIGSVPTEAWADPQRVSMCGSPLRGGADCGGSGIAYNVSSVYGVNVASLN